MTQIDDGAVAYRLTAAYWKVFCLVSLAAIFEFFDFYVVGFIVSAVGPDWQLTYGQSAVMLLSGGVGAIIGALIGGRTADRIGRRRVFVATALLSGAGSLALAFVADGDWAMFSLARMMIGAGIGGGAAVMNPYLVEFTPDRYRSMLPGLAVALGSTGTLAAALTAGFMFDRIGWRGIAVIGSAPLLVGLLAVFLLPESPRWLEARTRSRVQDSANMAELRPAAGAIDRGGSDRPSPYLVALAWLGTSTAANAIYLWGPTVLAMTGGSSVAQVARSFLLVSLAGLAGKFFFSVLPRFAGRWRSALIASVGGATGLATCVANYSGVAGALPLFLTGLIIAAFFLEGGYANLSPYTAELFPVREMGRAVGLAQAANGIGKVLGPLLLALIAGASDVIAPRATQEAVVPGFLAFAGCALVAFGVFMVCRVETAGRKLSL